MDTQIPKWLSVLSEEELHFVKRFVLASGSLKDLGETVSGFISNLEDPARSAYC